ncbi:TPA: hypothetical protein N0F65_007668 [Lagenidium giganteum]|uniref:TKL protein kinase n=1 Tax=Lagenidium giganteum TaxID=4803 RepID=A0AAV2Z5L7_9STRA|nr:TPA: hypothetical protein N0F65_007668 [Lagenidium giganteum]
MGSSTAPPVLDGALPLPPSLDMTINGTMDPDLLHLIAAAKRSLLALQICLLVQYGITFLLSVALICYMRYNRHVAFRGDVHAARKIILPAFEPLLWILCFVTGFYTAFFTTALRLRLFEDRLPKITTEIAYSGRVFVFLLVIVYMFQPSVSMPALRRSVLTTLAMACYTIPVSWFIFQHWSQTAASFWILRVLRGAMVVFFVYVYCRPPCRASKRTLREYCVFAFVFQLLMFLSNAMFVKRKYSAGYVFTYANLLWASLCPIFIWRVLKADTEHWRGISQRACALQSQLLRQRKGGTAFLHERISSQGLHVLIEMHRKFIIDFAYLELKQRIGVGASALVFNGILHSNIPVAVKMYTPADFTDDTVAIFSNEAALCGALHHPNIVTFYGMCISPPTICLVSELCQGSLEDITCAMARRMQSPERQEFLINLAYMLDCARAVAYLHSFSPAFVHRDIKPSNFLIDADNNVKLTDFGESRSLPRSTLQPTTPSSTPEQSHQPSYSEKSRWAVRDRTVRTANTEALKVAETADGIALLPNEMTVRGTVDYMAPELITGKAGVASYGEAADVFALAMTMWDILNPGVEKYPMLRNNHLLVFDWVMDGGRPALDPRFHPGVRQVIESAWHTDAMQRPSAQAIVEALEDLQEEAMSAFALDLWEELGREATLKNTAVMDKCFSGEFAVQRMEELGYVRDHGEATRVGNAMMDAGVLHHIKHARGFERHKQAIYYFDEECIYLYQPMHALDGDVLVDGPRLSMLQVLGGGKNDLLGSLPKSCTCRKLGQRLNKSTAARRKTKYRFKPTQPTVPEESHQHVLTIKLLHSDEAEHDNSNIGSTLPRTRMTE